MAIKINGSESNSIHSAFYNAVNSSSDSLALSQLWVCGFNFRDLEATSSIVASNIGTYEQGVWGDLNSVMAATLNPKNFDSVNPGTATSLYLWTRGITYAGDGMNVERVGSDHVGALKGLISNGRKDVNTANITFLESNVSFVDGILRPWSVLGSHRSLKDDTLRCDIELFSLEKWSLYEPLRVRKSMTFKNAIPVEIDAEEYNYTGDKLIERQVQFAYDRYEQRVYSDVVDSATDGAQSAAAIENLIKNIILSESYNRGEPVPVYNEGTKNYQEFANGSKNQSIIEAAQNLLGNIATVGARVQGLSNNVTSSVAQTLNAFGLEKQANTVTNFNRDFNRSYIQPVAEVVGTGQGMLNAVQNTAQVLSAPGGKHVNANDFVTELQESTKANLQKEAQPNITKAELDNDLFV